MLVAAERQRNADVAEGHVFAIGAGDSMMALLPGIGAMRTSAEAAAVGDVFRQFGELGRLTPAPRTTRSG